jgi:hypothetical protein
MAKSNENERRAYLERIKPYKATIETLLKLEKNLIAGTKSGSPGAALNRLTLADEMLNLASNYIAINGISQSTLKNKDEEALNDARKTLYKSVIYLEETVSNLVDAPYSDYEEKLAEIESYSTSSRYLLVRKLGLAIELLENAYGDNTKWRWSFVELEGRYATVAKNICDLRNAVANTDPRSPDYEPALYYLRLIKKLLTQSADRYREKYELSTSRIVDFKMGISFLAALRRLHIVLGDREEAETVKKKLDIWTAKLDKDEKKKEADSKKAL